MAKKENNVIFGIVVLVLFIILAYNSQGIHFPFSIVQTITCDESVLSNWKLDGNALDTKGLNNGVSNEVIFDSVSATFNGSNYLTFPVNVNDNLIMQVKDYSAGDVSYFFLARVNSVDYVNGIQSSLKSIIPLDSQFGLGRNISVKNIIYFSNLTVSQMLNYYNNGSIRDVCYETTSYENVTCKEYIEDTIKVKQAGCLSYTGDFFPICSYNWNNVTTYTIENNICKENFYCKTTCTADNNCYSTSQNCIENLKYGCYILSNNQCLNKTDYGSCVTNTTYHYATISSCQSKIVVNTTSSVTPTETTTNLGSLSLKNFATQEILNIAGYSITIVHLIIVLILIVGAFYLFFNKGEK
jgi:hypothetical protein